MVNLSLDNSEKEILKRDILHKDAELMRKKLILILILEFKIYFWLYIQKTIFFVTLFFIYQDTINEISKVYYK